MRFSHAFLQKYATPDLDNTSYMLAVYPDEKSIAKINDFRNSMEFENLDNLLLSEELHTTLRYWKTEDDNLIEKVKKWLNEDIFLDSLGGNGIIAGISSVDIFGENAIVAKLYSKPLMLIQKLIDKSLQHLGIEPSDYPTYRPHLTLAYADSYSNDRIPDFEIIFNRLALVQNNSVLWETKI